MIFTVQIFHISGWENENCIICQISILWSDKYYYWHNLGNFGNLEKIICISVDKWDSSTNWLMNQDFGKSHWFFCDIIRSVNQIQFLVGIQFCWKSIPIVESIFMFVTSFHINKRGFPPLTLISNPGHVLVLTTNFLKKYQCVVFSLYVVQTWNLSQTAQITLV